MRDELSTLESFERTQVLSKKDVGSAVLNLINYGIDAFCLIDERKEDSE